MVEGEDDAGGAIAIVCDLLVVRRAFSEVGRAFIESAAAAAHIVPSHPSNCPTHH